MLAEMRGFVEKVFQPGMFLRRTQCVGFRPVAAVYDR